LFTKDGRHVGEVELSKLIFGKDGAYLGELRGDRLLTRTDRKGTNRRFAFSPSMTIRPPRISPGRLPPLALPNGYEDFLIP
jgi:hypothetical protein